MAATVEGRNGASTATKSESREEMLLRHRKETTELLDKEASLKKAAAKGSKAEQKAKKKEVEQEISLLSSQLQARQCEELASRGYDKADGKEMGGLDNLVMAVAGISINASSEPAKPSRGSKRRGRRAQQDAEREQRIEEEQANTVNDRLAENENLEKKLRPLGLTVNEIKPDGHCLYRAIEDQLSLNPDTTQRLGYLELRKMAANYLREHTAELLPFFLEASPEAKAEPSDAASASPPTPPLELFMSYCNEVESSAAWGGQMELNALVHCLKKHVVVFSGNFPDVEMGKEYRKEMVWSNRNWSRSILLSYHVHAYGLGEHYNSVVPIRSAS